LLQWGYQLIVAGTPILPKVILLEYYDASNAGAGLHRDSSRFAASRICGDRTKLGAWQVPDSEYLLFPDGWSRMKSDREHRNIAAQAVAVIRKNLGNHSQG